VLLAVSGEPRPQRLDHVVSGRTVPHRVPPRVGRSRV
jgi:hypothetical protein